DLARDARHVDEPRRQSRGGEFLSVKGRIMRFPSASCACAVALLLAGGRAAAQERARGPVVVEVSAPFVAEGAVPVEHDQRRFPAMILTRTGRVPAAWPLVIHASITLDGDVLKSDFDALRCAPAIDGHAGLLTLMPPVPPAADTTAADTVTVDRAPTPQ